MGIKEELSKIIDAERQKYEEEDRADDEYSEQKKQRFNPLAAVIKQLADEIPDNYGKVHLHDDRAYISLSRKDPRTGYRETDVNLLLEPNNKHSFTGERYEDILLDGFKVEETNHYHQPEYEAFESTHHFPNEEELMVYVMEVVGKKIAYYQKLEGIREKAEKERLAKGATP